MAGQGFKRFNNNMRNGGFAFEKASFTDLGDPKDPVYVQFNPTEFSKSLEVEYARQTIPGLPHKVLQYISTSNAQFEMELYFTANSAGEAVDNLTTRKRLDSFCYPRGASSVADGGPPRILFVWPQFISLTTVITGLAENYTAFFQSGRPKEMTLTLTLEEIRDMRLLQEDVGLQGLRRSSIEAEGEDNAEWE